MRITEKQFDDALAHVIAEPDLAPHGIIRGLLDRLGVVVEPTPAENADDEPSQAA